MRSSFFVSILSILAGQAFSTSVSIPLGNALDSSNENSLTHHTFKRRNLINEQTLLELQPETRRREEIEILQRVRRLEQNDGGIKQVDPNSPQIKNFVQKGLARFSKTSKSPNEPFLIQILEATVEKAAHLLYKIKVRLGESTCPKGTKENCQLKENSEQKDYLMYIMSRPAIDHGFPKIAIHDLSESRPTTPDDGGIKQVDPNSRQIKNFVEKGLARFSRNSKSPNEPFLIQILEATVEKVAHLLYKIKVRLGESTCPKGTKINCQLKENSEQKTYIMYIMSRPAIDHGYPKIAIQELPERRRAVRSTKQCLGCLVQEDPNDP